MRSLQIIFTLLVLVVCARSVSGSDPYNPEPCTDPYTCKNKPILYGSIEGTKAICPGATGSWTLVGGALLGSKEKCKETPVDVTASEYWTYAVTGPEPTSGTGKTFSWAPTQPGDYKITWKGTATASPCDVDPIERTYDFKVYEEEFDPKLNVEKDFAAALEPKLKKVEELINSTFFLSGASLKVTGSLTAKGGRKCCDLKYVEFAEGAGSGGMSASVNLTVPGLVAKIPDAWKKERRGRFMGHKWLLKPVFELGLTGTAAGSSALSGTYKVITGCDDCFTITVSGLDLTGSAFIGGKVGGSFALLGQSIEGNGQAGWTASTGIKLNDGVFKLKDGQGCPEAKEMTLACVKSGDFEGGYSLIIEGVIVIPIPYVGDVNINVGPYDFGKQTPTWKLWEGTCK